MSREKIRLGFIGAGAFISARHLKTAGETPYMEIRAIADLNRELLAEHQKHYQIGYVTDDYRKLLADPEIDLIVIGTKQDTHAKLIIESLNAGKWVWCEKPMCETEEEEAAILEAEKNAAGRLAIGFNRRFAPAILKIRQVLAKLPRPWIISYRLQSVNSYNKNSRNSFYHDRPHIIYEGCHILDLAAFLMESQPERVFMSGTDDENDIVTMEYPDGSRFVLVITSHAGGNGLEKEMMEVFTPKGAMSMRDFVELRIRGIEGEQDQLFEPQRCPFGKEVLRWGLDFWQMLSNRLVWEDIPVNKGLVPIRLAPEEQPFSEEIEQIAAPYAGSDWKERNFVGDKGWIGAFRHFAEAFMNQTLPATADGMAGKMANDLGFALLESKKTGLPVNFQKYQTDASAPEAGFRQGSFRRKTEDTGTA